MLQISRDGEYALRAMLYLAALPVGKSSLVHEISSAQNVPKSFLAKIMQQLSKAGLVTSRRGANGGFTLARPPGKITLREAIEAIQGPINLNTCLLKKGECVHENECPMHSIWREAQKKLFEVLDSKTMEELVKDRGDISFIKFGGDRQKEGGE